MGSSRAAAEQKNDKSNLECHQVYAGEEEEVVVCAFVAPKCSFHRNQHNHHQHPPVAAASVFLLPRGHGQRTVAVARDAPTVGEVFVS